MEKGSFVRNNVNNIHDVLQEMQLHFKIPSFDNDHEEIIYSDEVYERGAFKFELYSKDEKYPCAIVHPDDRRCALVDLTKDDVLNIIHNVKTLDKIGGDFILLIPVILTIEEKNMKMRVHFVRSRKDNIYRCGGLFPSVCKDSFFGDPEAAEALRIGMISTIGDELPKTSFNDTALKLALKISAA